MVAAVLRRDLPQDRKKAIKRVMMARRYKATGPDAETVEVVYVRAGYACEICDAMVGDRRGVDHHIHHRRPRGVGGSKRPDTNSPANLLLLCPDCHRTVESRRGEALGVGWLVPQPGDPAATAVLVHRDRWTYLGHDGTYRDDPPEVAP